MANRFLNNIRINDAYTFPASDGNDGQVITTDGAGNLAFENISPDAASVIYRDNFTGDGSTVTFDLQNSITDEDQTQIYIDGVYQEKSTYSISGTTITFTTAPILGHSVEVISISSINTGPTVLYQDNFTGNGSNTAFILGQEIDNEIKTFIFLNGVYQFKNTYTVDGATLTFDTAPANGVAIEVVSIASAVQSDSLEAGAVIIPVKNTHTASIAKGTPVYITGNVGSSERLQIAPADASNSAKMPAAGLLLTTLAVNAEGYVITGGYLRNITTDTIDGTSTSSNDTVYVKAGGGLTMTKPTGNNLIQNIAKVARSASANAGSLLVSSILRTNDIPNLTTGKIWVGSANNTIESGTLHLDESNNRLGINNNLPNYSLDVTGDANISSNVIIGGNLTVDGTQTILNTQTVEVEDNILQLNTTQGSPDTATATTSGISIYRGDGVTQASFIFDDADDTWDLTDSLFVANNIDTASDKRISVGTWDNSGFGSGTAYGFSVTSSTPLLHLTESDQTNKKGYIGLTGGNMYVGGLISNLYLQTGTSGTTALTIDGSQNATFAGIITVNGGGIDIDNNDDVRLRFDNASVFKAGLQVVTTAGDMIAGSAVNDFAIRAQENMLFATGGNTERMRITSAGKVGIGSNPTGFYADQLVVNEGMTLYSTGNSFLCFADGASGDDRRRGEIRYEHSSNTMAFMTDASTRMRIDSSGITTLTAEGYQLAIKDESSGNISEILTSNTAMGFFADRANAVASTSMIFSIDNDTKMTIDSSGQVGIGTTLPDAPLEIQDIPAQASQKMMLHLDANHTGNQGSAYMQISAGSSSGANTKIEMVSGGGLGLFGTYVDTNIINSATSSGAYGNINFITGSSTSASSIVMTIGGGSQKGKVGIGTESPGGKLEVKAANTGTTTDYATKVIKANAPLVGGYSGTKIVSLLSGFDSTIYAVDFGYGYNGTGYDLMLSTNDNLTGNPIERMRIDSSGRVCIDDVINTSTKFNIYNNNSSLTYALGIESTQYAGTHAWFRGSAGTTGTISYSGTSTSYNTSSDYRLKENVVEMAGALDRVSQLKPSRFNFIADADTTVDGFLAHEVSDIVPEAITGTKDEVDEEGNPIYQGIDQSKLVPLLVGAIKELKAEIETLKTQING